MSAPLRPLSLGELLDQTFSLYRSNFLLFIGIVALPQLLTFAANLWLVLAGARAAGPASVMLFFFETMGLALLSILVISIAQGAVVIAVSHLHLGRPASIASSYAGVKGNMVEICLAALATGFLEGIGLLLLIVPGVLLALRWALVIPAVALEQHGVGQAMSRSSALTKGHRGRIFMIFLLYTVLMLAISLAFTVGKAMITGSFMQNLLAQTTQSVIISQVLGFVTQCLIGPMLTISLALVYYDERVRKEAFDLEHMLSELDADGPAAAPVVTA